MANWESRSTLQDLNSFDEDLTGQLKEAACEFIKAVQQDFEAATQHLSHFRKQSGGAILAHVKRDRLDARALDDFTNDSVLGCQDTYPKTLHEYALENPEHWWWYLNTEKQRKFRDYFINIRNFAFLGQTRHGIEYHSKLPHLASKFFKNPVHTSHDVWLICKPYASTIEAFRHWSVLTQGRNIHLTADKRTRATGLASPNLSKRKFLNLLLADGKCLTEIDLKWKDLSSRNTREYRELQSRSKLTKFVAYNVGQTMYTPLEVCKLARAIIERMREKSPYHLFENNCQHFVISLIRRIVVSQRRDIAIGGTILEIADFDQRRPGVELKPWLTPAKKRLLFLTNGVSKSKMRNDSVDSLGYIDNRTWAHWVHSGIFKKTWLEAPLEILRSEHPITETKAQYKQHAKEHVDRLDHLVQKAYRNYAFLQMVLWARTFLAKSSLLSSAVPWVKYAIPAAGAVSFTIPGAPAMLGAGFFLYLFISRTMYARGSAKPVHYDIKRVEASTESSATSSEDDSDHEAIRPDEGGGGHGDDIVELEYTALGLLEDGFRRADLMFSPEYFDQGRATPIPLFTYTTASDDPPSPQETATSEYWDGRGAQKRSFSHSSSPEPRPPHDWTVRRASAPATELTRPRSAGSPPLSRAQVAYTPRSYSLGVSCTHPAMQRRASSGSPLRYWTGSDMVPSQPNEVSAGQLPLPVHIPSPIRNWNGPPPHLSIPLDLRRPRSSVQRRVSSPLQPWDEEALKSSLSLDAGTQPLLEQARATSQPPYQSSTAMVPYEECGRPSSSASWHQRRASSQAHQLFESRSSSRQGRSGRWTLSSPPPRRRPAPRHSASMPVGIDAIQFETDFTPSQSERLSVLLGPALVAPPGITRSQSSSAF